MQEPSLLKSTINDDFIGIFKTNHPALPAEDIYNYLSNNGLILERSQGQEEIRDEQAFLNRVALRYFNDRLIAPVYQRNS